MTRPRHTPGPWRIHLLANGWPVITSDAHDIADLRLNGRGLAHVEANAALIAAAPKLLSELQQLLDAIGGLPITILSGPAYDALFSANAAIAQATTLPTNQPERSDHHE
jgi:hypothetical protein